MGISSNSTLTEDPLLIDKTLLGYEDDSRSDITIMEVDVNNLSSSSGGNLLSQIKQLFKEELEPVKQRLANLETENARNKSRSASETRAPNSRFLQQTILNAPSSAFPRLNAPNQPQPSRSRKNTNKLTFSQALASSKTPIECIRNVNITGDCEKVMSALRKDGICADVAIK